MSEVKRYEPDGGRGECYMSQKYDGDYVHYSDYQTLESENARLRDELRNIATAIPGKWLHTHKDSFQEWAQSRARAALQTLVDGRKM